MIIIVLAISTINLLETNAAPMPEGPSSITPELKKYEDFINYQYAEINGPVHHRSQRMSRSILDQESSQELDDDLETAAGTNLLRPLFVYRQQMAYRERSRKDGRRAAPTYY